MLTDRDYLARLERPLPHPEAVSGARLKYMRDGARLMVRLIALDTMLAPRADHSAYVEALSIVQCFGLRCRAANFEVINAAQAEFSAANAHCSRFVEALRRELWGRCRAQQPRDVIMGAARDIARRWEMPISDDQLVPLLAGIWTAAQPYKKNRRGRAAR